MIIEEHLIELGNEPEEQGIDDFCDDKQENSQWE